MADDDLEGIEGTGQRSAERSPDSRPCTRAHQSAQIIAPQF